MPHNPPCLAAEALVVVGNLGALADLKYICLGPGGYLTLSR
jgi:hypothetical protein